MYTEAKKFLLLIRRHGICLKYEKIPEELKVRIWNNIRQKTVNPKPLTPMGCK